MTAEAAARVLVLEDDPPGLELASYILTKAGYDVVRTASAEEAQRECSADTPDMIVADLRMSPVSGLEFARWARQHLPALPIMAISAWETELEHARASGDFDRIMAKPIEPRPFLDLVEAMVGHGPGERRAAPSRPRSH